MIVKDYVSEYIDKIRSGEIIVCKKVRQLYLNIIEPVILDEHEKYYYDYEVGHKFIEFAERFTVQTKGEWHGKKTELMLFQKAKYQAIFGIFERETNRLRFDEIFDVRGRKNGKSSENAILGIFLALKDKGAEIYVAATTYSQAKRVWDQAVAIIDRQSLLRELLGHKVYPEANIYRKDDGESYFKVLSNKIDNQDGLNASCGIVDEAHELARERYDILKQAMTARDDSFLSIITTAGYVREKLYDDLYEYSEKVLDGLIEDDKVFPLIYELDDAKEVDDPKMWIKANPGLGIIKKEEKLAYMVKRMKTDLNLANAVKTKDFNIRGVHNSSWLTFEDIDVIEYVDMEGMEKPVKRNIVYTDEELSKFDNTYVIGGFDLSRTKDITAFTTLLFDQEKYRIIALTMYWITHNFFQEQVEKKSRIPWKQWVDRGLIRLSGTSLIDYHDVADYVYSEGFKKHKWMYLKINYDSYSAQYLVQELISLGYSEGGCLERTQQGYKTLSVPMQLMEAHLKENKLCYQNNPVTKWMLSNIELIQDRNGNFMPKKAEDKEMRKIDGPATILNCYVSLSKDLDTYMGTR